MSREKHVQVDGKFADAVLGDFGTGSERFIVAVEGKGPKDPLDRPFAGRRMSAVDQGYRYAINLPCDWIIVTSIRQTRLYYKGADQQTYERFDTEAAGRQTRPCSRQFVFLLGAERVVPASGRCHLYDLLAESETVGRELTKEFYVRYADMRQDAFARLCQDNPDVPPQDVLACTQKLLDRVLFCAFCEDRGLLPRRDDPQGLRAPRPVPPAADLGQLPRAVPGDQRRQRGPGHPRLQRRPVRRRPGAGRPATCPTRSAATSATWATTTTARRTRRPPTPTRRAAR